MNHQRFKVSDWIGLARESGYCAQALASRCGLSLRQLERLFTGANLGTPRAWMNQVRVLVAGELLLQDVPIKCVAAELRYGSLSLFYTHFKRAYDCTPVAFCQGSGHEAPADGRPGAKTRPKPAPDSLASRLAELNQAACNALSQPSQAAEDISRRLIPRAWPAREATEPAMTGSGWLKRISP